MTTTSGSWSTGFLNSPSPKPVVSESPEQKFSRITAPPGSRIRLSTLQLIQYPHFEPDTRVNFRSFNLVVGANGAGKSILLDAINTFLHCLALGESREVELDTFTRVYVTMGYLWLPPMPPNDEQYIELLGQFEATSADKSRASLSYHVKITHALDRNFYAIKITIRKDSSTQKPLKWGEIPISIQEFGLNSSFYPPPHTNEEKDNDKTSRKLYKADQKPQPAHRVTRDRKIVESRTHSKDEATGKAIITMLDDLIKGVIMSGGVKRLMAIGTSMFRAKDNGQLPSLLTLDELEVFLNERLWEPWVGYLRKISSSCQVIASTHSSGIMRLGLIGPDKKDSAIVSLSVTNKPGDSGPPFMVGHCKVLTDPDPLGDESLQVYESLQSVDRFTRLQIGGQLLVFENTLDYEFLISLVRAFKGSNVSQQFQTNVAKFNCHTRPVGRSCLPTFQRLEEILDFKLKRVTIVLDCDLLDHKQLEEENRTHQELSEQFRKERQPPSKESKSSEPRSLDSLSHSCNFHRWSCRELENYFLNTSVLGSVLRHAACASSSGDTISKRTDAARKISAAFMRLWHRLDPSTYKLKAGPQSQINWIDPKLDLRVIPWTKETMTLVLQTFDSCWMHFMAESHKYLIVALQRHFGSQSPAALEPEQYFKDLGLDPDNLGSLKDTILRAVKKGMQHTPASDPRVQQWLKSKGLPGSVSDDDLKNPSIQKSLCQWIDAKIIFGWESKSKLAEYPALHYMRKQSLAGAWKDLLLSTTPERGEKSALDLSVEAIVNQTDACRELEALVDRLAPPNSLAPSPAGDLNSQTAVTEHRAQILQQPTVQHTIADQSLTLRRVPGSL